MSNELVAAGSAAVTTVTPIDAELQLVAKRPEDMQQAQQGLVAWYRRKVELVRLEARDAQANLEIAKQSRFKAESFARASRAAEKRVVFYEKCLAAVEAGFAIVPNFPVDVFAIRVTRDAPKWRSIESWSPRTSIGEEEPALAAAGEGRYVNPIPTQRSYLIGTEKKGSPGHELTVEKFQHTVADFIEEVEFPAAIAQPAVLDATRAAMALNLFDEIGCLPARQKPDPIVIGRIYRHTDKRRNSPIAFLIAWWIDTRTL